MQTGNTDPNRINRCPDHTFCRFKTRRNRRYNVLDAVNDAFLDAGRSGFTGSQDLKFRFSLAFMADQLANGNADGGRTNIETGDKLYVILGHIRKSRLSRLVYTT